MERKGFIWSTLPGNSPASEVIRTGTQGTRKPLDKGGTRLCISLYPGLLSLLPVRIQDHQPAGPPALSLIRKLLYRTAHSPILWRHFLNKGSLLSEASTKLNAHPRQMRIFNSALVAHQISFCRLRAFDKSLNLDYSILNYMLFSS